MWYEGDGMTFEKAVRLLENAYQQAKQLEFVRNPLAYALYKVWKIADKENDHGR